MKYRKEQRKIKQTEKKLTAKLMHTDTPNQLPQTTPKKRWQPTNPEPTLHYQEYRDYPIEKIVVNYVEQIT